MKHFEVSITDIDRASMVFGFDIEDDFCIDVPDLTSKQMKKMETERQKLYRVKPSDPEVILKKPTLQKLEHPKSPTLKDRAKGPISESSSGDDKSKKSLSVKLDKPITPKTSLRPLNLSC